jgi:FkbM family methyltransferase
MGIGARSSLPRRLLFRAFSGRYFRRRGRTKDGYFEAYVSPSSSLRLLDPRRPIVDPIDAAFIGRWVKPGAIIWDIGANLGLFALPAALRASQVYAFEPDISLAACLRRSLRLRANRRLSVAVIACAVSDVDGIAAFEISRYSTAMNKLQSVGHWNTIAVAERHHVPTLRIDRLAQSLPPPDLLKIDVEGAEIKVLEGGRETIARKRPIILIEGPSTLWEAMTDFFNEHRYAMFDAADAHCGRLSSPVWDTLAIPMESTQD